MAKEIVDIVNENDEIIGQADKDKANSDPKLTHREVSVTIFNDQNEVLLQQRSFTKVNGPGVWTVSASGHVTAGEDPQLAAQRELEEELGLTDVDLKYYKKEYDRYQDKETRFFYIFYGFVPGQPELKIQQKEVEATKWIAIRKFNELAKAGDLNLGKTSQKHINMLLEHLKFIN